MHKFIFDVDGTLTPSRGKIDDDFKKFFVEFCKNNNVYLVTGSDKPKTVEQIGDELYSMAKRVYNCSGSEVWVGDRQIKTNDWKIPYHVRTWLKDKLEESNFPLRTGLHIEERVGMINFILIFVSTAITGAVAYQILATGNPAPMVGASGSVFGLFGFLKGKELFFRLKNYLPSLQF